MVRRFLQADSLIDSKRNFGMNRYMYVDGNPMKYRDNLGKNPVGNLLSDMFKKIFQPINIDLNKFWKSATNMNDVNRLISGDVSLKGINRKKSNNMRNYLTIGLAVNGLEGAFWGYLISISQEKF